MKVPSMAEIGGWVEAMKVILKGVEPGMKYVALDGWVIDATAKSVRIEGWHAMHDLDYVPQVKALQDKDVIRNILGNRQYWNERAIRESH